MKFNKSFLHFIKSNTNLYNLNIVLIIGSVIALSSHIFLSRGLDEDGSFNLVKMIIEGHLIYHEISRLIFNILHQLPSWLYMKFPFASNLSVLTKIYSFGLIWVHILSLLGCYFILPLNHKKLIFFPLFSFITGPLITFGISVSVALSVFSYIWLAAFVIHYSDLSIKIHKILFFLVPIPLFLAHEMMSYMAWPLIALCLLKERNEKNLFTKFIIRFITGLLFTISITSIFFIFANNETVTKNFLQFKISVLNFKFLISEHRINLQILAALFLKISLFMQCFSNNIKNMFQKICLSLIALVFSFVVFIPFPIYNKFFFVEDYFARVWSPVFSLPLSLLFWWLYETHSLKFKNLKIFLFSCFIFCITLTVYRAKSDIQFYRHQKQFSEQLKKCQGVLEWSLVKNFFRNIEDYNKLEKQIWKVTSVSLIYPRTHVVRAIILHTDCMNNCLKSDNSSDTCKNHCDHLKLNMPFRLPNSRFFNFKPLSENMSKKLSLCKK